MPICSNSINPLYNNYFRLVFSRGTRQLELMCQKVSLPGIAVGEATQPTALGTTIPYATTATTFDPLRIEFIVDYDLTNWKSLYSWIRNITNIENDVDHNILYQSWHIKANLEILNPINCNSVDLKFTFHNVIPVNLGGINFQTDNVDVNIVKSTAAFKYSYYTMDPDAPSNLLEEL
jgi:hypothetical protein